ncbi:MAG TPA: ATP-dependent DNA helicase UvrD2 [Candidatus Bathyarchaeia archaeon]|nr:ATP-dependent DNA helicase UvrD2 [Candidatus Bathyarchaeia archaeon]
MAIDHGATLADADRLLEDLNEAQREAVVTTRGPLAILAGAGTGKTRVISRRAAYAIATDAVTADQVLVVTFTDKAAGEMVERLAGLGLPGVVARTFHAHALSQLRHFWPSRHDGAPLPDLLDTKLPILIRIARGLPGHYRFTAVRDLATEIEWAKSRGIGHEGYEAAAVDRTPPIPADLMRRVFADYERAKSRGNRIDFDDLLTFTADLLATDEGAAAIVRSRKSWFSVDEYQDTSPLQQRLLELWAGDSTDVSVVGDEDQTIYTFTGATSTYLTGFAGRYPGARIVALTENYRSSPQVLDLANRLLAGEGRTKGLTATRPDGPLPTFDHHVDAEAELAAIVRRIRGWLADGTEAIEASEIAILVRMNAQLAALEEALTRAGIAYVVRGIRFYERREIVAALAALRRARIESTGPTLAEAIRALLAKELGHDSAEPPEIARGDDARERAAALETFLAIVDELVAADPATDADAVLAELRRRAAHEREGSSNGVNLLTYHRAKGLEWDAVILPMLEDGSLPIRQAIDDPAAIAEERRLFYVGITRARRLLNISWADRRETRGRDARRQRSRFLDGLLPAPPRRVIQHPDRFAAVSTRPRSPDDDPLLAALRAWRTSRAREDAVPAFVVLHDTTLAAIADQRPASLAALRRVQGIGPAKLDKYGDEVLAVIGADSGRNDPKSPPAGN